MKITLVSGNPKLTGLCQSVTQSALAGARAGLAEATEIRLNDVDLLRCQVCDDGWGPCRDQNICRFGTDGFTDIQNQLKEADALILATPVYWGECSESLKCFLDRLRRCEFGEKGALAGKQVILIASAGGTGNGIINCLNQLEQFCRHTGMIIFDRFGINRWNADYQSLAVQTAVKVLAEGRKAGQTVAQVSFD